MAVFKRTLSSGKETRFYYYKFKAAGEVRRGVCTECTTKKEALAFEKKVRGKYLELAKQKSLKAMMENFRDEFAGGNPITLEQAFDFSLKKPRKKPLSGKQRESKRSYWGDFLAFMKECYPDVKKLSDVKKSHAEEYIGHLRTEGRFNKKVLYQSSHGETTYERKHNLSPRTCNVFHNTLREVFSLLAEDAGLLENPFATIPKLNNDYQQREAFTEDELRLIAEKADKFIYPIFAIGISTALRAGDICTLRWDEIDFERNLITRRMLKTGNTVEIPIMPPLRTLLEKLSEQSGDNEYVLPEHAAMYLKNSDGISWRVKKFLKSIGIKTTKKVPRRTREISIKDVHSLRHTFCYMAGAYGIPFLVVKDICGHVSEEMTALYQKHASVALKREKLRQMPDFMGLLPATPDLGEEAALRHKLKAVVEQLSYGQLRELESFCQKQLN